MTTMGQRIRQLRRDRGMTQAQLSEATGLRIESISRLENDKYPPTPRTVRDLARALGVAESELEPGRGDGS
jgi:transcriptional regulator with XRE-family HTH domain